MIDKDGYRPNVGIIVANQEGKVLWAKCIGKSNWQFPQGGIDENEDPLDAAYRELYEETGLEICDVELVASTRRWLRYIIPKKFRRKNSTPICIGQKQKWFLMRLKSVDSRVCLNKHKTPEFDKWRWVDFWHPLEEVVFFKRAVYRNALCELAPKILTDEKKYLPEKHRKKYCNKGRTQ